MDEKRNQIRLKFIIKKDFSTAGDASSSLKKILKSIHIQPAVIRKIAIASFEAEVNVIAHADGGEMDVILSPDEVKVIIKDEGPGIQDIQEAMKPGFSTATDDVRNMGFGAGMGLPNINNNVDKLDIQSILGKGTTLTFSVLLS